MNIVIIGTGNVATVLGKKIRQAGHDILQVYGRNAQSARELAETLSAGNTDRIGDISADADLYIISVSDPAIAEIASQLKFPKKLIVHTAGSVSKHILAGASKNYGVLYPLQSLRKQMRTLPEMPLLVDGNTSDDLTLIYDFAKTITDKVIKADDDQRLRTHIAAVIVSNFTNHLYTLADMYCREENIDFKLLLPLIEQVALRLHNYSPIEVQTGPAIRNDQHTIDQHLSILTGYPQIKNLYAWFSSGIQEFYKSK